MTKRKPGRDPGFLFVLFTVLLVLCACTTYSLLYYLYYVQVLYYCLRLFFLPAA